MIRFFRYSAHIAFLVFLVLDSAAGAERPRILVGGDHNNPPYEFLENGKPTGFNVELMQATADVLGLDVEIRLVPWNEARRDLELGKIDALAGMYHSLERRKSFNFSVAHTMVTSALFVRQDSPIRSFKNIQGKEIIVQQGDIIHDYVKKEGLASHIITVMDPDDELTLLASGKHDAAFMPSRLQGEYLIKKRNIPGLRIIETSLPPLRYCFAVAKGNPELRYRLDEGLNILRETGKYREIYEKWFGVYEKNQRGTTVKYFVWALAVIAVFFVLSVLWSWTLQRQVRLRTAELRASEEDLKKARADLEKRVEERTVDLAQKTAELERSNKELELFASIASHDLRAPLTTIGGFAELLQDRYSDKLDEKARRALAHIANGTLTMSLLINDLLAYARVTSGGQSFRPVHSNTVVNTVLTNLLTDISNNCAVVTFDDLPIIYGDETQFVQLFQNLIGNAIKYRSERPPRIHVSAKPIADCGMRNAELQTEREIQNQKPPMTPGWLFSVMDNGIGIDQKHQKTIFEIFKRLHSDSKYAGTGIGLAVCKKIVERHNGRIWVESEPGEGSTFFFTIPDQAG